MMRISPIPIVLLVALAGCSSHDFARDMGMARDSPDEFTVTTRAPLELPNDDALPAPQPGAARPQEPSTDISAEAALVPQVELRPASDEVTAGQQALLAASGPEAPDDIRNQIDAKIVALNNTTGMGNTLAFWSKKPLPGRVIDANKEAARLRAQGIPVLGAPGAEIPTEQ